MISTGVLSCREDGRSITDYFAAFKQANEPNASILIICDVRKLHEQENTGTEITTCSFGLHSGVNT